MRQTLSRHTPKMQRGKSSSLFSQELSCSCFLPFNLLSRKASDKGLERLLFVWRHVAAVLPLVCNAVSCCVHQCSSRVGLLDQSASKLMELRQRIQGIKIALGGSNLEQFEQS